MVDLMRRPPTLALGRFLFKHRSRVFPLVLIALMLGLPPVYFRGSAGADHLVDLVGILITVSGQVLRVLVIGFAYIKRGGLAKQVYADDLVTRGVFATVRNPLYIGNLLILLGLFVVHGNPLVLLVGTLLFVIAYQSIVATEEDFLRRKFGTRYEAYCDEVARWWPDFARLPAATAGMRFDWRRVVSKDCGSAIAWLAGLMVLLCDEIALNQGLAAALPWLGVAAAALALLLLATPLARRAADAPAPASGASD
jgi:protein-S-isoprenylcysteine O-methyltransferase Ste14